MVLKQLDRGVVLSGKFYSSVILNGTETVPTQCIEVTGFYSSVILNGTETAVFASEPVYQFYSSVILNGTETSYSLSN